LVIVDTVSFLWPRGTCATNEIGSWGSALSFHTSNLDLAPRSAGPFSWMQKARRRGRARRLPTFLDVRVIEGRPLISGGLGEARGLGLSLSDGTLLQSSLRTLKLC
jgi:hypothetical protein